MVTTMATVVITVALIIHHIHTSITRTGTITTTTGECKGVARARHSMVTTVVSTDNRTIAKARKAIEVSTTMADTRTMTDSAQILACVITIITTLTTTPTLIIIQAPMEMAATI